MVEGLATQRAVGFVAYWDVILNSERFAARSSIMDAL